MHSTRISVLDGVILCWAFYLQKLILTVRLTKFPTGSLTKTETTDILWKATNTCHWLWHSLIQICSDCAEIKSSAKLQQIISIQWQEPAGTFLVIQYNNPLFTLVSYHHNIMFGVVSKEIWGNYCGHLVVILKETCYLVITAYVPWNLWSFRVNKVKCIPTLVIWLPKDTE